MKTLTTTQTQRRERILMAFGKGSARQEQQKMQRKVAENVANRKTENAMKAAEKADKKKK